jgi:dihydroorotase
VSEPPFDLVISAGRIVCLDSNWDGPGFLGVRDQQIAFLSETLPTNADNAREFLEYPDGILLRGLIDLHAHPAVSGSKHGVDPDKYFLPNGVTTVLSQGDAGANNWEAFRKSTIENSKTRVRLALNLSSTGESRESGCFSHLEDIDVDRSVETIRENREFIWGLAVNVSKHSCAENDPRPILQQGIQVAEAAECPILFGMHDPKYWPMEEQLALLRPGDVVTYLFRSTPHNICESGHVNSDILEARKRGVLFDGTHGVNSFDFRVVQTAFSEGFYPDTISSDFYRKTIGLEPPHSLVATMSKMRAAGMPEPEVFAAVTTRPAKILRMQETLGSLRPETCADLTLLEWDSSKIRHKDVYGNKLEGGRWKTLLTIRAGKTV